MTERPVILLLDDSSIHMGSRPDFENDICLYDSGRGEFLSAYVCFEKALFRFSLRGLSNEALSNDVFLYFFCQRYLPKGSKYYEFKLHPLELLDLYSEGDTTDTLLLKSTILRLEESKPQTL